MILVFNSLRGHGAFRFVKVMSKATLRFSPEELVAAAEAAFDKFSNGTFGSGPSSVSFTSNYAPPVGTQEKLFRDILVLELSQFKGWRHGRGFGEKDVVNTEDNKDSALVIISADAIGFRQEHKDYRIRRKVNATGYYIAVNFEPILIINDKIRHPRLALVRHGFLKVIRSPGQTNQNLISIKFNDLRQLKLAQGPYLHDAPIAILKGIGRAGVRALEDKKITSLGELLEKKTFAQAQGILNPQSLADLNKYLDYLKKVPKPAGKQAPPPPKRLPKEVAEVAPTVPPGPVVPQLKIELKKSRLATPAPIVSNPQANEIVDESKALKKGDKEYASAEEADLDIPLPPPPKIKQAANVEISDLVFFDDKFVNNPDYQYILIECEGCGGVIKMPVPKAVVLTSPLPVVPVTYVHGKEGSRHAILAHLDHDFQVRRIRFSHLVEASL